MVKSKLKILFHLPNPNSIYAGKTIFNGYKHAFEDMGHSFKILSTDDNQKKAFSEYKPDIFFTSINALGLKYLDLKLLKNQKKSGMKVFVNTPFWSSPFPKNRINEAPSLKNNKEWVNLIKSRDYGDIYHSTCEEDDPLMKGFTKSTGYKLYKILLAADKKIIFPEYSVKFSTDISYIGTYLPGKKKILDEQVKPLFKKYKVKIYGQDWSVTDKILGMIQRGSQYFNIPYFRSFLKQPLKLEDERRVYTSSKISINIHEDYQKSYPGNLNERTFKIPLAGGFEVVDNVPSLKKYFKIGKEIIVADNKKDWFEKIDYFMKNPQKKQNIILAGKNNIFKFHTYHNRIDQIIKIYLSII